MRAARLPLWVVPAAVGVNLLLFGMAAFLLQERALLQDITDPIAVSLVRLEAPSMPEQDPMKEPEKPQPKQRHICSRRKPVTVFPCLPVRMELVYA